MNVGVTGAVGAGKSLFARHLCEALTLRGHAVRLIDADQVVNALYADEEALAGRLAPDGLFHRLAERFGRDILTPDGRLDRKLLAERSFPDAAATDDLNRIVHPYVRAEFARRVQDYSGFVIHDVPLLYECGLEKCCAVVIVVTARDELRRARSGGLAVFAAREARQWTQAEKAARATHVVENNGTAADLAREAARLADLLTAPANPA